VSLCRVHGIGGAAAIIIGHNNISQGARSYNEFTEFDYNSTVAFKTRYFLEEHKIEAVVVERKPGALVEVYADIAHELNTRGIKNVYELHFNSFSSQIWGGEALYQTPRGKEAANRFLSHLSKKNLAVREARHTEGLARGGKFLLAMSTNGIHNATLLEPCFANFENVDTKWFFEDSGHKYSKLLTEFIREDIG